MKYLIFKYYVPTIECMKLTTKIFEIVKRIPKGEVMTYKEIARFAGNEKAYRSVGRILHTNTDPKNIPCHRVVKSDFTLANGYAFGGRDAQKKKLINEGIIFEKNKIKKL